MSVYMASGCASLIGKVSASSYSFLQVSPNAVTSVLTSPKHQMVAVWFPISAFVAMGFDHSVANMFIIPLGMLRGADVSVSDFLLKNLLPVTLGNIVGGALCVMGLYGSAFGNWGKKKDE